MLENERRVVSSLQNSLQAKEQELTTTTDSLLQEKLGAARAQVELEAVRAQLDRAQQVIYTL